MRKWKNKDLLNCAVVAMSGEAHGGQAVKDLECWSRVSIIGLIDNENMLFIFQTREHMVRPVYTICGVRWKKKKHV